MIPKIDNCYPKYDERNQNIRLVSLCWCQLQEAASTTIIYLSKR